MCDDAVFVRSAFSIRDQLQSLAPFYRTWASRKAAPDLDLDKELLNIEKECRLLDEKLPMRVA